MMQNLNIRREVRSLVTALMLGMSAAATAAPTAIYEIESTPATYVEVYLDREIYSYSRDPLLRDLLVLDREGREMPSRILTLKPQVAESTNPYPLSFFPVQVGEDPVKWLGRAAELHLDDESLSLRLDPPPRTSDTAIDFYLIDISKLEQNLDILEVDWFAEDSTQVVTVEISASNDLQQWRQVSRETLVRLSKEGESLLRNRVRLALKPEQYQYLRLRFLNGSSPKLQNLVGRRVLKREEGPPPQRWQLSGTLAEDQRPLQAGRGAAAGRRPVITAWEFLRDERAPVNRISIALGDLSYGEQIRLYSRSTAREDWQLRYSGIWFNVKVGNEWQQSEPLTLRGNSDPYWRLELNAADATANPRLVFEHPQQRLRFIANNNPPYVIAISEQIPTQRTSEEVFNRVLDARELVWQSVSKQLLEGVRPVEVRRGLDWAALIFWLALGLAVLVLIAFALRLVRQMDTAANG